MSNRVLSAHQRHELLLKLEQAGLIETDAQAVIESENNTLAREIIGVIRERRVEGDWFSFTTSDVTINDLREQNPDFFHQASYWWESQAYANMFNQVRQLLLLTSAHPRSFNKDWGEQQNILVADEYVPTAIDLIEGMIAYQHAYGKWPTTDYVVRTNDLSSLGGRACVGFFRGGLYIDDIWDSNCDSNLGLSVALKSTRTSSS